ncbi:MAG: zf-HC2 domain-containing protein [Clostridiales bacterium]|jgi:hypothetical protein|nr:zf-HC2 domain-containing protein [Clostridiales bacterium]
MECEKAGDLMMKYMDGVLTDAEAASLNRHIQTCGHCKEDFLVYDGIMNDFSDMTLSEAPEGFERRVMAIIAQLPEMGAKSVNLPVYGIIGVFSLLLSLGFILVMNKEAMLSWMYQYPELEPLRNLFVPASAAVDDISMQVSSALAQMSSYLRQAGSNLSYVTLILFGLLAAAQFVIYRRERAVAHK